jgi:membrane-bound serine protease (ClpP class)
VETVITLILVGAVLLLLETVLPGMIAGLIGLGCVVAGVVVAYTELGTQKGHLVLLCVSVGLTVGFLGWLKMFPTSRFARWLVSQGTIGEIGTERPELLNQTGTALTRLRPSGTAVINGRRVDVVSEGMMIERGQPVRVVAVEGLRVVVRAV